VVRGGLDRLGELAAQTVGHLRGEVDHPPLTQLVNQARHELARLGLENQALTTVLDEGLRRGATAGKLSGAGGGGAFFLLFPDAATAEDALEPLVRVLANGLWVLPPQRLGTHDLPGPGHVK